MEGIELLNDIRLKLKVKKSRYNTFGEFNYRSCEDILEAVKPLLGGSQLLITDDIIMIGERYYLKAIVEWSDESYAIRALGFAREPVDLPKMNQSQVTGSASSYARKYALSALFLLDDGIDADSGVIEYITSEQVKELERLLKETKTDKAKALSFAEAESLDKVQVGKYEEIVSILKDKANGNKNTASAKR